MGREREEGSVIAIQIAICFPILTFLLGLMMFISGMKECFKCFRKHPMTIQLPDEGEINGVNVKKGDQISVLPS